MLERMEKIEWSEKVSNGRIGEKRKILNNILRIKRLVWSYSKKKLSPSICH